MPDDSPSLPGRGRHWLASPGSAALLGGLTILVWMLRQAVVSPKALGKARERWAAARGVTDGVPFKWEDAAVLGTHYSTLVALTILLGALLTMQWWYPASSPARAVRDPSSPAARQQPKWFMPGLIGIVLAATLLRLPLATGSLWWDELWNVKFATVGEWRQEAADPDEVRFQATSWSRAAWYYNKPTNHPVLTLPSKLSHSIWQKLTGAAPGTFSEIILRLPVLLGGLTALVLTALLTRRWAGEPAGILAAVIFAVHPWLIRYGVDARSYGLAVTFMAAALFSLERATAPDSRRAAAWWWVFGGCQFFLMWAHVVAHLSLCAALFAAGAWLILRGSGPQKSRQLARLVIVNGIAAALLLVAFLPNLLQALTWDGRNDDGNLLTGSYLLKTLTQIVSGMDPPATTNLLTGPWLLHMLVMGCSIAIVVAGARTLCKTQPRSAVIILTVVGSTAVFLVLVHLTGFYFYHRFIITVSIPLVVLAAIGLSRIPWRLLSAVLLLGFVAFTWQQTRPLLTLSYAPFRETVADMRAEAVRLGGHPLPVAYGLGSHVMQCYYPELRDIRSDPAATLQSLIDEARRGQRPLLLALGYEGLNRHHQPDGFRLLDDPALFERISTRHGIEPEFTFHLLKLK